MFGRSALCACVALSAFSFPAAAAALVDVLVNDPALDATTQDTQTEAFVRVLDATTVLVAYTDTGSAVGGAQHVVGISRSTNGAASFSDLGRLPDSQFRDAASPIVARDAVSGRLYLATQSFNSASRVAIFRSVTNGATWVDSVAAIGVGNLDRPWIAVDNAAGPGQGNVYVFVRDFQGGSGGMRFSRSTDAGDSYSTSVLLAPGAGGGVGARLLVDSQHFVYAFWLEGGTLRVRRSSDLGVTFAPAVVVANIAAGATGDLGLDFAANAYLQSVASPTTPGLLYVAWADRGPPLDRADLYLARSTDSGATWSTPTRVNTDATTNDQFGPSLAITPDGTHLFVGWYDRRRDPDNRLIEYRGRIATLAGTTFTFGSDFPVSSATFRATFGQDPLINPVFFADYDVAAADDSFFYAGFTDTRLASLAHAFQPDVRLAKIPVVGPGPVLFAAGTDVNSESCGVNGRIEPGEDVAVELCLRNEGTSGGNIVGTLLPGGGVTNPGPAQTYGAITPGGQLCRTFEFRVDPALACGGNVTASLQLADGAAAQGTVQFRIVTGVPTTTSQTLTNPTAIAIVDDNVASPYPSNIVATGVPAVSGVAITLNQLSHTFPQDIDVLLVAPSGATFVPMSDAAGGSPGLSNATIALVDTAGPVLPNGAITTAGPFRPADYDAAPDAFPAPAPPGPYARPLPNGFAKFADAFAGGATAGTWSLYVRDDAASDSGSVLGGWSLTLASTSYACTCPVSTTIFANGFE